MKPYEVMTVRVRKCAGNPDHSPAKIPLSNTDSVTRGMKTDIPHGLRRRNRAINGSVASSFQVHVRWSFMGFPYPVPSFPSTVNFTWVIFSCTVKG